MVKKTNDINFLKETDEGLFLIDFFATWCGPCRSQKMILDILKNEYEDSKLKIIEIDIDKQPKIASDFEIMSVPTLILKKNGKIVEKKIGTQTEVALKKMISPHL